MSRDSSRFQRQASFPGKNSRVGMRDGIPSPKESRTSVPQNMGIITSDIWYIMQCHWKKLHRLSRNCQNIRYHVWKSEAPYPRSAYRVVGPHLSTESPRGFAPSVVNFCLSFPRWRNGERDNFCENTSKRFERGISFYINSPGRQGWMCAQPLILTPYVTWKNCFRCEQFVHEELLL